jgi:hypothetical protein
MIVCAEKTTILLPPLLYNPHRRSGAPHRNTPPPQKRGQSTKVRRILLFYCTVPGAGSPHLPDLLAQAHADQLPHALPETVADLDGQLPAFEALVDQHMPAHFLSAQGGALRRRRRRLLVPPWAAHVDQLPDLFEQRHAQAAAGPDVLDDEGVDLVGGGVGEQDAAVGCPDAFVALALALGDGVAPAHAVALVVLVWVLAGEQAVIARARSPSQGVLVSLVAVLFLSLRGAEGLPKACLFRGRGFARGVSRRRGVKETRHESRLGVACRKGRVCLLQR